MKIGFIGFGQFALLRKKILDTTDGITFSGYYEPQKKINFDQDLVYFEDVSKLIDCSDALLISTPTKFAPIYTLEALKKNKNVFCEKPPSRTLAELSEIEKLLSKSNLNCVLAYGFNHRLHDSVIKIKELIDGNNLGKVLWMRGRYGKEVNESYKTSWRCSKELNGGGILIDQGIHLLDLMNFLSGGFDFVQSVLSSNYLNIKGVEDNAFLNLMCKKDGLAASLHSTITQWRYLFSLEIFLEKGSIVLNGLRTSSGNYGDEILTIHPERGGKVNNSEDDLTFEYNENNSWKKEMSTFIKACKEGIKYPYSGFDDAKTIMKLIDDVYENAIWMDR